MNNVYTRTQGEEIVNSILHGIGVLLSVAGMVLLVLRAHSSTAVYVIFAGGMILMFLVSTMYHAVVSQRLKALFRIFDHQAIYLFIAGTYTPYCLLALQGALGWVFFGFEWTLALTGIVLSAVQWRFLKKAETVLFVLMGWAILAGCVPLARSLSLKSLILLFAGGIAYTLGVFWYRAGQGKSPERRPSAGSGKPPQFLRNPAGFHIIWHLFVLAGAVCHWFSVWFLCLTA
ncbi:MAG: hemolysin III family protein [Spirochaetaceae bacterium]|jgi:hemolysin III|nr:hemolysin III family protein [Spirochaetaceae bacterium]